MLHWPTMSMDVDEISLRGNQPVKEAVRVLQAYEAEEGITGITIQFETTQERQASYHEFDSENDGDVSVNQISMRHSSEELDISNEKREKMTIQSDTAHHWMLHVLHQLDGHQNYVRSGTIRQKAETEDMSQSSIFPALTNLWEREIADRKKEDGSYSYKITDHGQNVLDKLGTPTRGGEKND